MTRTTILFLRGIFRALLITALGTGGVMGLVSVADQGVAAATLSHATVATSPVPKGFRATSISWTSAEQGWVLGTAPCVSKASGPPPPPGCTYVVGTSNGGKAWDLLSSLRQPLARIGQTTGGVTEIRFATLEVGWVFGPNLLRTVNGGESWSRLAIPGAGKQVVALAASAGETYAMVSPCPWGSFGSCTQKPYTLWRTPTSTGPTWTNIPLAFTPPKGMQDVSASVALFGKTVYAMRTIGNAEGTVVQDKLYASTDGVHFSTRPDPCDTAETISLTQVVATSAADVALLCEGEPELGSSPKVVYWSTDTGKVDTSAGMGPLGGISAQLAASPTGNLAVSSASGASFIDVNDTHKTTWTRVVTEDDGGLGWNDIVYVDAEEAWIVHAPAVDAYPQAPGQVFVTRNGGKNWTAVSW